MKKSSIQRLSICLRQLRKVLQERFWPQWETQKWKRWFFISFILESVENIQIQVEKLLAEPLSLAVIDQVTKEGWEEGWQVEEMEMEEEEEEENGKVEETDIGGKKEELGRIPLTVPRSLLCLQIWENLIDLRTFWMY